MTRWLMGIFVLMMGVPALAHDFWLTVAPPASSPDGMTITGDLGEYFPVADTLITPFGVMGWRVVGASGEVTHSGLFHTQGQSLATTVALPTPGTYVGLMEVRPAFSEMTGAEFTEYLREEGLEDVIAERAALGRSHVTARERYWRYAKIIIPNGQGPAEHVTRAVGTRAELVPATDPTALGAGDVLSVRFLVNGVPVPDAQIAAVSDGTRLVHARTNAQGIAELALPTAGRWLIRNVHMFRPLEPETPVEWESYWTTLAFTIAR